MITVTHTSGRSSKTFHDNYFDVTDVPMKNINTIILSEALNDENSPYKNGSFSPKANGSSYTIAVRGYLAETIFTDVEALKAYIETKLNDCSSKLELRNT